MLNGSIVIELLDCGCICPLVGDHRKRISPSPVVVVFFTFQLVWAPFLCDSAVFIFSGDSSWLQDECADIKMAECPAGSAEQYKRKVTAPWRVFIGQ